MATRLKGFDFDAPSTLTTTEKATYPWEDWFDGDVWQIEAGEDFTTHPLMMERIIRTRASSKNHKAKVTLRHLPVGDEQWGIIVMQRTDIAGPTERKRQEAADKRKAKKEAAAQEADAIVKDLKQPAKKSGSKTPSKRVARPPQSAVA